MLAGSKNPLSLDMGSVKYEQISKLNDTELIVYNYIIKNMNQVLNMNIRELAS